MKELFTSRWVWGILVAVLIAAGGAFFDSPASAPRAGFNLGSRDERAANTEHISDETFSGFEKDFGSYFIEQGWLESEELSRPGVFFYLKEGTELDKPTSNISVSASENRYSAEEAQLFARAIDQQLREQISSDVAEYFGGGSFTENGYPLITMTIVAADGIRTVQYYIVGDYRFVMVHLTDFNDERILDAEAAALSIVNSFVWAD